MFRYLNDPRDKECVREALRRFYQRRGTEYGLDDHRADSIKEYVVTIKRFASGRSRILDYGCGDWRSPLELWNQEFIVTGLDMFSRDDHNRFQEVIAGKPGLDLVSYDGRTFPFEDATFDFVASLNVLEHVLDVPEALSEMRRVLKPGGRILVRGPNWGGINNPVRATLRLIRGDRRYFQFESVTDSIRGLLEAVRNPIRVAMTPSNPFIYIYPRMTAGEIDFEESDDDAVHLCLPGSFKRWFLKNGFDLVCYNRGVGATPISTVFNGLFPSMATSNLIVAELPDVAKLQRRPAKS